MINYLNKKSIKDLDIAGKRVLLRCDFNVPLDENRCIEDSTRINESLPTIKYLLTKKSKIILCSHLGRPNGIFNANFSLEPVCEFLQKLLNQKIYFIKNIMNPETRYILDSMKECDIALLENLRFHPQETNNDEEFSKLLASFADFFIIDAFGTCHRAHASTAGISKYLPSGYGLLIEKELSVIENELQNPKRPFVAILGGAKVSDKIGVISNLLDKVDTLIVGGGMSYTFTNALGYSIGNSIFDSDHVESCKDMIAKAKEKNIKFLIPLDNKVGKSFSQNTEFITVDADKIPEGFMGLDIGPASEKLFCDAINNAKTIFWNGPLGVFEWENFSHGTKTIAESIAKSNAISIVGGGDSVAAIKKIGLADKITHISTGGGATLKLLEGSKLPALEALDDK